jgi:hypothetical protein
MINLDHMPRTLDGRIDWKFYFEKYAKEGDQFEAPSTMRSGIQRQACECGFVAQSTTIAPTVILVKVSANETISRKIIKSLTTLSEANLIKIHNGCVQAGVLGPLQ